MVQYKERGCPNSAQLQTICGSSMAIGASSMQPCDYVRTPLNEVISNNEDILEDLDHEKENETESNQSSKRSTTPSSIQCGKRPLPNAETEEIIAAALVDVATAFKEFMEKEDENLMLMIYSGPWRYLRMTRKRNNFYVCQRTCNFNGFDGF